jgi:hypothetical protein
MQAPPDGDIVHARHEKGAGMATLVAIGYPDASLSEEDTKKLQEALTPTEQVGAAS